MTDDISRETVRDALVKMYSDALSGGPFDARGLARDFVQAAIDAGPAMARMSAGYIDPPELDAREEWAIEWSLAREGYADLHGGLMALAAAECLAARTDDTEARDRLAKRRRAAQGDVQ